MTHYMYKIATDQEHGVSSSNSKNISARNDTGARALHCVFYRVNHFISSCRVQVWCSKLLTIISIQQYWCITTLHHRYMKINNSSSLIYVNQNETRPRGWKEKINELDYLFMMIISLTLTKQSWKWRRSNEAAILISFLIAFVISRLTIFCRFGQLLE